MKKVHAMDRSPGKFQGSRGRGRGRATFRLKSWDSPPNPGKLDSNEKPGTSGTSYARKEAPRNNTVSTKPSTAVASTSGAWSAIEKPSKAAAPQSENNYVANETVLIARYKFQGNKNSPLGEELSFIGADEFFYLRTHPGGHWLYVRNAQGKHGFIPASYVKNRDDLGKTASSLPWLSKNEEAATEEAPAPEPVKTYKKYQPSYKHEETKEMELKKYFCTTCAKQLNGPHPYNSHMNGKAHKEMVEYYEETDNPIN